MLSSRSLRPATLACLRQLPDGSRPHANTACRYATFGRQPLNLDALDAASNLHARWETCRSLLVHDRHVNYIHHRYRATTPPVRAVAGTYLEAQTASILEVPGTRRVPRRHVQRLHCCTTYYRPITTTAPTLRANTQLPTICFTNSTRRILAPTS
jgi:hypothetical protein